nr:YCF48-related protein [Ignavibacteria bacterium]
MKTILFIVIVFFNVSVINSQWIKQTSGTAETLLGVAVTSSQTIYVSGTNGLILKTVNGGFQWNTQSSGTANFLRDIYFSDPLTGYIVGESGRILKTTNGG